MGSSRSEWLWVLPLANYHLWCITTTREQIRLSDKDEIQFFIALAVRCREMSRIIAKLNVLLCVVLLCHSDVTLAFISVSQHTDNCFVLNQTFLTEASNTALLPTWFTLPLRTSTLPTSTQTTLTQPDNSPLLPSCQQAITHSHYQQTSDVQTVFIKPLPTWFGQIQSPDLPIPASLVFVMLWLIGFTLTRQPEPMLKRTQTPISGKDFIVKSLSNNKQLSSY